MKITYDKVYELILYAITILWFIRLGHPTIFISFVLSLIAFMLYINQSNRNKVNSKIIIFYILSEITLFFVQVFRLQIYHLSSISIADLNFLYSEVFLLVLIFPLYEVFCAKGTIFFSRICRIGIITLLIKTIVWFFYNFFDINIGFTVIGGDSNWIRYSLGRSLCRMTGTALDGFIFSYLVTELFFIDDLNRKIKNICEIIFLYLFSVFVTQSRAQIIYYTFVLVIGLFYYATHAANRLIAILSSALLVTCLIIIFREGILNFVNSFSVTSSMGDSTQIRLLEYSYFSNLWQKTSPLWGFGMINEPIIVNGIGYWLSDLGIADILYQFGYIGLIIGIIPFIYGLGKVVKIFNLESTKENLFFICMLAYYIISMTNLNPYRNINYLVLPFYIAYMLYVPKQTKFL